ncbi:ShlB/FhaC/HecB family hemolysin secretion/activation protein [Halomicronema hongdechloris]|nr:ShlB/FhaC/HecB family hemolysin secretion/activation protein [Halomicronema hongdechloris]
MRLPADSWLQELLTSEEDYSVHIFPASAESGLAIGLFTCDDISPDCLIASFSTLEVSSPTAQAALQQHQAAAAPITLAPEARGYLLDGSKLSPQAELSSVVWVQDNQLYAVRFPADVRQTGLYLAHSMAIAPPLSGISTITETANAPTEESEVTTRNQIIELSSGGLAALAEALAQQLPAAVSMRLPERMLSLETTANDEANYQLEVIPTTTSDTLTASIFTCRATTPDCFLGHFSASAGTSAAAEDLHRQHQEQGNSVTLSREITAYVLELVEGDAFSPLVSVMWQQDRQFYRLQFPVQARQNMLFTALSMIKGPIVVSAHSEPVAVTADNGRGDESLSSIPEEPAPLLQLQEVETAAISDSTAQALPPDSVSPDASEEAVPAPASEAEPSLLERAEIEIRGVEVKGSTIFDKIDFQPILEEAGIHPNLLENETQTVNLPQLINVANGITQLYVDQGYITSQAIPPNRDNFPDVSENGIVYLQVIEGQLGEINIQGTEHLQESYVRSRLELGVTSPLRIDRIEEQLRLLQVDPNLSAVEATLKPTGTLGLSNLEVTVEEAPTFVAGISVDNYSPPRVGSERTGIDVALRNLAGWGDSLSGSYFRSTTGGAEVFDFRYTVPLNAMNGTLQFRAAPERNEVTLSDFRELGLRGEIERYGVQLRQPVIRSLNEELALSLGFTFQEGQTFVFDQEPAPFGIGPDEDGVSRTSVFTFRQEYVSRDSFGAWALQSQFNFGTGLFEATANPSSIPDGQFFSWLFQAQRLQRLSDKHLLVIGADVQLTPNMLLPAHQFTIGGGQLVRGFRQNARSGDNGFRFSIEDRITVTRLPSGVPEVQLAPFVDMGMVWNTAGNPNILPEQRFLAGVGIGGIWDWFLGIERLSVRLDYALPLIDLEDRGNNAQDSGFYFRVNYRTE